MRTPHWGGQAGYVWICSLCGCYLSTRSPYLALCSTSPPPCSSSPSLCLGRGWGVHHHSTHWQPGSWRKVFVVRETSNLTLVVCSERVDYSKANISPPLWWVIQKENCFKWHQNYSNEQCSWCAMMQVLQSRKLMLMSQLPPSQATQCNQTCCAYKAANFNVLNYV